MFLLELKYCCAQPKRYTIFSQLWLACKSSLAKLLRYFASYYTILGWVARVMTEKRVYSMWR